MTADQEAAWQQIEAAAKKEGTLTYYSLGSVPQNKIEMLQSLWQKDYPEIKLEYLYIGNGSVMAARLSTEQDSKNYVADIVDVAVRQVRIMVGLLRAVLPAGRARPVREVDREPDRRYPAEGHDDGGIRPVLLDLDEIEPGQGRGSCPRTCSTSRRTRSGRARSPGGSHGPAGAATTCTCSPPSSTARTG